MIIIEQKDNIQFINEHFTNEMIDMVYADIMFDDPDLRWIEVLLPKLKQTGVVYIHTDQRSVIDVIQYVKQYLTFQSWIIWSYDWGGRPKNKWANKHDDILFFSKGNDFPFYKDHVQIPKKTLINSTKTHKIPTDVWNDIGIVHTMSKEKDEGEHRVWQKPIKLTDRIMSAHLKENEIVFDPFLGTGTSLCSASKYTTNLYGCDTDKNAIRIAIKRLNKHMKVE